VLNRSTKLSPIGLDIGGATLKLIQFRDEAGQPVLQAAANADLPPAGDPGRGEAVARAIEQALKTQPFRGRHAVTALGPGEFQIKSIRLPHMPADELASAVQFEAQDRFELGGRSAQFRHFPAGEVRHGNELKDEIIVFAAPEDTIRERLALLESLKLEPLAIDLAPCAMARSFVRFLRRAEDARAVNVFIDVGWRATSIVITHASDIAFLKLIDVGGQHFTEAIASSLGLGHAQALELRLRIMRQACARRDEDPAAVSAEIRNATSDAVRPLIERLQRDVQLCLRYFAVTFRGRRPDCLTFVGGAAHEPLLAATIAEAADLPTAIGHPLRGIGRLDALAAREQRSFQPAWAVACGLALRGSRWVAAEALAGADRRGKPAVAAAS
jgi:type IV pilus assembly protein PilM